MKFLRSLYSLPLFLIALASLLISEVPRYIVGLTLKDFFLGQVWGAYDLPLYIETIHSANNGAWTISGQTLAAPANSHYFLYFPYLALGHIFSLTNFSPLYQLEFLRLFSLPIVLITVLFYLRSCVPAQGLVFAYFVACFAGGLGAVFAFIHMTTPLGPIVPLDLVTPAFNVVNSLNTAPHVALGVAALALFARCVLLAIEGSWKSLWGIPCIVFVASFHAFVLPSLFLASCLLFLFFRRRQLFALLSISGLLILPLASYLIYLGTHDPYFMRQIVSQYSTDYQNLPSLIISHFYVIPLIAIAIIQGFKSSRNPSLLLAVFWLVFSIFLGANPLFSASPIHRTIEGSSLPWAVLAGMGFVHLPRRVGPYLVGLMMLTPLLQAPTMVLAGLNDPTDRISSSVYELAIRANHDHIQGSIAGSYKNMRIVASLSDLRDLSDDPQYLQSHLSNLASLPSTYLVWDNSDEKLLGSRPNLPIKLQVGTAYLLVLPYHE